MRRALVAVFLVPLAACLFPALDSLDSNAGDASPDVVDAGAQDASDASDAGASSPCADASHFLCDDFDEPDVFAPWTTLYVSSDTTTPALDTDCVSHPYSLACATSASASFDSYARLMKTLPDTTSTAHLEFDVKLGAISCDAGGGDSFFEIFKFGSGNETAGVELKADDVGWFLNADVSDGGAIMTYLSSAPAYGTWHHVLADVTFSTSGTVSVSVDGVSSAQIALDLTFAQQNTGFLLGLYTSGSCPATVARFDNAALDVQ